MRDDGMVRTFAYAFDGEGGGHEVDFDALDGPGDAPFTWVQLDHANDRSRAWLSSAGLDPIVAEALLDVKSRPRCKTMGKGLLVILRAVNLNPGADPEDMVSLRVWIDARRAITVRTRRIMAIRDLREAVDGGEGPTTAGEFLVRLTDAVADRMAGPIAEVEDAVDTLEDELLDGEGDELGPRLGQIRRKAISLHRHLAPQREVMARLVRTAVPWLGDRDRAGLQEVADDVTRYVEDIDSARRRSAVAQEELGNRLAEEANRTMYLLTIVATIFLPLSLLTGLLGVNLGGIPGAETPSAFLILCLLLGLLAVALWIAFKRKKIL